VAFTYRTVEFVTNRTKVKLPQPNRLDANSFVSVKLYKQTKNKSVQIFLRVK